MLHLDTHPFEEEEAEVEEKTREFRFDFSVLFHSFLHTMLSALYVRWIMPQTEWIESALLSMESTKFLSLILGPPPDSVLFKLIFFHLNDIPIFRWDLIVHIGVNRVTDTAHCWNCIECEGFRLHTDKQMNDIRFKDGNITGFRGMGSFATPFGRFRLRIVRVIFWMHQKQSNRVQINHGVISIQCYFTSDT